MHSKLYKTRNQSAWKKSAARQQELLKGQKFLIQVIIN
jgi:hypothetical protein